MTDVIFRNVNEEILRQLFGLIGRIGKAMGRLAMDGKLPSGLPKPVGALREPTARAWKRTGTFIMPSAFVPVLQAAAYALRNLDEAGSSGEG
jgi:hypothetical protein